MNSMGGAMDGRVKKAVESMVGKGNKELKEAIILMMQTSTERPNGVGLLRKQEQVNNKSNGKGNGGKR
jgi:hypothetical protein